MHPATPNATTHFQHLAVARRRHACAYLRQVRPAVVALGVVYLAVTVAAGPGPTTEFSYMATGAAALLVAVTAAATRWIDPVTLIAPTILLDTAFLLALVMLGSETAAGILIFPIIAMAYFRSPRETAMLTTFVVCAIYVTSRMGNSWDGDIVIPAACYSTLIAGGLLAFIAQQVRRMERELDVHLREQQGVIDAMADLNHMRDRLIANVSHELRTPLTSTIGFIETLLREDIELPAEERRQLMLHARGGGQRLLALVEDLLSLGTTRAETLDRSAEPIPVSELIEQATGGLDVPDGRELRITLDVDPAIRVDRLRVLQVIGNLVVNALKHGAGTVEVACTTIDGHAIIDVIDEGSGVRPERIDELFLPFSRFSDRADSTGLGLAISLAIVEAHAGSLSYARTDGQTQFRVELPME